MVEPVGLAVGILGLAGLFSSCLDAAERFESWKNFGDESRFLGNHFEAEKLRLKRWGEAVGFDKGVLLPDHHEALDDPRVESRIREHLSIIENTCNGEDDAAPSAADISTSRGLPRSVQPHPGTPSESKRQRVKWAIRDKAKCTAQVHTFGLLVQDLHNLVPPDGANGTWAHAAKPPDAFAGRELWTVEFRRILDRIDGELHAEKRKDLHTWLLGRDLTNELYENAIQKRLDGTCDWILRRPLFLDWASFDFPDGSAKLLWINGPAGFGKTVLSARVIEHLSSSPDLHLAHFFFSSDFESRRDPYVAIRSWLSQLMSRPAVFELILEGWGTQWGAQYGKASTRAEVVRIFQEVVHAVPCCTFVMDGLDECTGVVQDWSVDDTSSVLTFLKTIQLAVAGTTTRILVTSRDEPDIRHGMTQHAAVTVLECKVTLEDVKRDTEVYSRSIVDRKLSNKDESVKDEISRKLAGRCNGQFLWVKLQEPSLRSGKNKKQLEAAIDKTPAELGPLYDRNWERILGLPEEEKARAFSLLRWVAFSVRPLTVYEITEALLIDIDYDDLPVDEMPDSVDQDYIDSEILGVCGSLMEVRSVASECSAGLKTVHLTHFSVKQYFLHRMSDRGSLLSANERLRSSSEAAHNTELARMCLRYVNMKSVWTEGPHEDKGQIPRSFRDYAASSWHRHATAGDLTDAEMVRLTNELFDTENQNWHSWRAWFELSDQRKWMGKATSESPAAGPSFYAAWLSLAGTVSFLIKERKYRVDDRTPTGITPLAACCISGSVEIAKMLLEEGSDLTITTDDGWIPLNIASRNGHVEVVKLLLNKGADPNITDKEGWASLSLASYHGHVEVVKLLLDKGANFTVRTVGGWTPLYLASYRGNAEVVKLLLKGGANAEAKDDFGQTALFTASEDGHTEVVKVLLEEGVNTEAKDESGWTALLIASKNGHLEVVKLLLEGGVNTEATDNAGWTALLTASENGGNRMVKLLLEKGANAEAKDNTRRTALFHASAKGQMEVVQALLSWKVAVGDKDRFGSTPLFAATRNGQEGVVSHLLGVEGACADFYDGFGRSLLWWAKRSGNAEVAEAVLQFAERRGIQLCGDDLAAEPSPMANDSPWWWCDVCTRPMSAARTRYSCLLCHDFDLCLECHDMGASCLDESHELVVGVDG
ncbi:related to ankyrin [Cephalotrichum gorgonifer]|uniref:Related to ankyrin n=1 Tax=Cephalotrichum gorgonifer TaxID=2041049 RepID=A0AAE8MVK5_9PEZI|nr:related to ankyrin [Cephalotrichum gorgonifer]